MLESIDVQKYSSLNPYLDPSYFQKARDCIISHKKYTQYLFFRGDKAAYDNFIDALRACDDQKDFEDKVLIKNLYEPIVKASSDGVVINGLENIEKDKCYVFVSTHRDIVLDSVSLTCELLKKGYKVSYPVIGSNLMFSDFASSCFALLRGIVIRRSLPPREVYEQSMLLSSLIFDMVSSGNNSVWIAGGAGRSKDGTDLVKNVIIKMVYLSKMKQYTIPELLSKVQLVPVSISYEKDPDDILKSYQVSKIDYVKTQNDDIMDIQKGILQQKGRIEINISAPVVAYDGDDTFDKISARIQDEFHRTFRLFALNYYAYDLLFDTKKYQKFYKDADCSYFDRFNHLPEAMKQNALLYYANPVVSRERCEKQG